MHEVGLVADAIEQAVKAAQDSGADRIQRLHFEIAPYGHVTPEIVQTLFESLSRGTIAEGAQLSIGRQVATLHCWGCGSMFIEHHSPTASTHGQVGEHTPACPSCGSVNVTPTLGADVVLTSIDVPEKVS